LKNALCLGSFDGLLKGHRAVLNNLPSDYKKIAVTFKIPPKATKQSEPLLIMSLSDKCDALYKCGIDEIHLLDFEKVKDTSPFQFLQYLKEQFSPELISCGFNYRFGKNGEGDVIYLAAFCEENNIEFKCVQSVNLDGVAISSTTIREYIQNQLQEDKLSDQMTMKEFIDPFTGEPVK
jgi:riboflavin kinase/FMN adenylyltransferase